MPLDRRVLAQESNSIRLAAVFGFVIAGLMLFVSFVPLFGFDARTRRLSLFSAGHLLIAPFSVFVSIERAWLAYVAIGVYFVQLVLDTIEIYLRITPLDSSSVLELRTISQIIFIAANFGLILVDIVYLIFDFRYITALTAAEEAGIIAPGGADEQDFVPEDSPVDTEAGKSSTQYTSAKNSVRAQVRRRTTTLVDMPGAASSTDSLDAFAVQRETR